MRARANSTMRVTQRQHGHMHVKVNLPLYSIKHIHNLFSIIIFKENTTAIANRWEKRGTYPTIQITAPTREIMRDKKAKGKPRRNPRGLNLQSSPQQQHMAIYLMA